MTQPLEQHWQTAEEEASVSTIMPDEARLPIDCDVCGCHTHYTLGYLKTLPRLHCTHCGTSRHFSALELTITQSLLARHGFHFRR